MLFYLFSYFLCIVVYTQNVCGIEHPFMCWCAIKKLLTQSLLNWHNGSIYTFSVACSWCMWRTSTADTTGLPNITDIINMKRHALFRHVVRLDASKPWNKSLQWKLAVARLWTGKDPLDILERHGYSRLVMEQQPAGDRCGRMQRNVDIGESRRNGPQPSMLHDDDDYDDVADAYRCRHVPNEP